MAFDPGKFKTAVPTLRPLPVVLLLDVSGSMSGDKIKALHTAATEMIQSFADQQLKETEIIVSIITFGQTVDLHIGTPQQPYLPVTKLRDDGLGTFTARGGTPMGVALSMAKDLIEDRDATPKRAYRPIVVLVSDGQPNDDWREPMKTFLTTGRTANCQRYSVAIGYDADEKVLRQFAQDDNAFFLAADAASLADTFRKVSTQAIDNESKSRMAPPPKKTSDNNTNNSTTNSAAGGLNPWGAVDDESDF